MDKSKAKAEAEAKVRAAQANSTANGSTKAPVANADEKEKKSPFEPPYVEDLLVEELEGLEGEDGMIVLVSPHLNAAPGRVTDICCPLNVVKQGEIRSLGSRYDRRSDQLYRTQYAVLPEHFLLVSKGRRSPLPRVRYH